MADRWATELAPQSEAEEAIIRASADAFARVERARRAEEGALDSASRAAVGRWEKKRRHAARRTAQATRARAEAAALSSLAGATLAEAQTLPDLLDRTLSGRIDPSPVFDLTLPIEDAAQGYRAMHERTAIKVLLTV